MSTSKFDNLIDTATPVAMQGCGFMLGLAGHRGINRLLETDTMQGLLGNDTATSFKRFVTPIIVTGIGIAVSNYVAPDSLIKDVANGFAVSGAVNVGMELFFNTNLMVDKGNGIIGNLLGGDDDLDYFEGYEDVDDNDEAKPSPALPPVSGVRSLPPGKANMSAIQPSMIAGPKVSVIK